MLSTLLPADWIISYLRDGRRLLLCIHGCLSCLALQDGLFVLLATYQHGSPDWYGYSSLAHATFRVWWMLEQARLSEPSSRCLFCE